MIFYKSMEREDKREWTQTKREQVQLGYYEEILP